LIGINAKQQHQQAKNLEGENNMNALQISELEELDLNPSDQEHHITALKERFNIRGLGCANWAFRKIAALRSKILENKSLADAEVLRIQEWLSVQTRYDEAAIALFEGLLVNYFQQERGKDSKFKLSTPYGKIQTHKGKKWHYEDDTLVKSLKSAGLTEYIRISESPAKDMIKRDKEAFTVVNGKLATTDGEIIDGAFISDTETISVKTE